MASAMTIDSSYRQEVEPIPPSPATTVADISAIKEKNNLPVAHLAINNDIDFKNKYKKYLEAISFHRKQCSKNKAMLSFKYDELTLKVTVIQIIIILFSTAISFIESIKAHYQLNQQLFNIITVSLSTSVALIMAIYRFLKYEEKKESVKQSIEDHVFIINKFRKIFNQLENVHDKENPKDVFGKIIDTYENETFENYISIRENFDTLFSFRDSIFYKNKYKKQFLKLEKTNNEIEIIDKYKRSDAITYTVPAWYEKMFCCRKPVIDYDAFIEEGTKREKKKKEEMKKLLGDEDYIKKYNTMTQEKDNHIAALNQMVDGLRQELEEIIVNNDNRSEMFRACPVNAERPLSSDNAHAEIRRLEELVAIKDAEYAAMVAKMSEDIKNISKENEMRANMYECNAAERPSQAIITDNENEIARLREKLRIYDQDIYEMRINMRTTEAKSKEAHAQNEALMAELSAMRNQMYSINTSNEASNQEYIEKLRIMERRCRELEVDSEEKSRLYKKRVLGFEEQFEDLRSVYAREKQDKENILIELREKEMMLKEMRDKKKSSNEHIDIVINEIDVEKPQERAEERNVGQHRPSTPFNLRAKHASNEVLKIDVNNEINDPEINDPEINDPEINDPEINDEKGSASDNESDDDDYLGKNPKITSV